jgi:hypothetical protein
MAQSAHKAWDRLLGVATLGTRRAPIDEAALWPDPALTAAGEAASAELKLLRAAAAQRLHDVAGIRAATADPAEERMTVAVDRTRFVSEAAAMRLLRMTRGEHARLIEEWLKLALDARRQLPPQFVPLALAHLKGADGARFSDLLGPTGQWLASKNPDWQFAFVVAAPAHERWQSGTFEERRAELFAMRKHDPAQARAWLQETWTNDPPDQREAFVRLFATGLSRADEPFLEAALDDKRKAVRQVAVQLLASLADSQLSQRHCVRLDALVSVEEKKGLLAKLGKPKLKLTIALPEAIDKAAQRDGIEVKPPAHRKIGERAFWLAQMVALAPTRYWNTRFQCDAATFIEAVQDSDYAEELLPALNEATARHPEREWLHALSDAWLAMKYTHERTQAVADLMAHVPDQLREELLIAQLSKLDSMRHQMAIDSMLQAAQFAYGPQLTRLAMAHVRTLVTRDASSGQQSRNWFDAIGYHCDVVVATELLQSLLNEVSTVSNWRKALERLNDIVDYRAAMRREIL